MQISYSYHFIATKICATHQVQCNIPTFEALVRKNIFLFLQRCRRSSNAWLPALTQSDCLYSWTLQPHFILWLSARTLQSVAHAENFRATGQVSPQWCDVTILW